MFALVAALSCTITQPGTSPAPLAVTDQSHCVTACAHLAALGCAQSNPIDMHATCRVNSDCKGPTGVPDTFQTCSAAGTCMTTCTNFCIETENNGVYLDPTCVAAISSCSQVDTCPIVNAVR